MSPTSSSRRRGAALLCTLAIALLPRAARSQRVYASTYAMRMSETAPGNLLPSFRFMLGQVEGGSEHVAIGGGSIEPAPFVPGDSCPEQIFDHASADLHAPNLPYLTQDLWDCARVPTNVSVLAYEDAHLRLSITPQFNGRMFVPEAPATTARAHLRRSARRRPANLRRRPALHCAAGPSSTSLATATGRLLTRLISLRTSPCSRAGPQVGSNGIGRQASSGTAPLPNRPRTSACSTRCAGLSCECGSTTG
jgi:hypothetical protein